MIKCIGALHPLLLVLLCMSLSGNGLYAQSPKQGIEIWTGRKEVFKQNNQILTKRDMIKVLEKNPETYTLMSTAKSHYDLAMLCRFAGTVMTLVPIASYLREGDPMWGLLAGGLGLWALSIPLYTTYEARALAAAQLHNKQLKDRAKTSGLTLGTGFQCTNSIFGQSGFAPGLVLQVRF